VREQLNRYRVEDGIKINCAARAYRSSHDKNSSEVPLDTDVVQDVEEDSRELLVFWDQCVTEIHNNEVEVYTDGSMRYHNSVFTRVLTPPISHSQPIYTQGGIVIHFGHQTDLYDNAQIIAISLERGMDLELLLPSSMKMYTILLAVRLLYRAKMFENIFTDFAEVVRIQTKDKLCNKELARCAPWSF